MALSAEQAMEYVKRGWSIEFGDNDECAVVKFEDRPSKSTKPPVAVARKPIRSGEKRKLIRLIQKFAENR